MRLRRLFQETSIFSLSSVFCVLFFGSQFIYFHFFLELHGDALCIYVQFRYCPLVFFLIWKQSYSLYHPYTIYSCPSIIGLWAWKSMLLNLQSWYSQILMLCLDAKYFCCFRKASWFCGNTLVVKTIRYLAITVFLVLKTMLLKL